MRIGILTWFFGSNYGAKAQSYALQKVIQSYEIDAFMIDYRHANYKRINREMNYNYPNVKLHPVRYYKCLARNKLLSDTERLYNLTCKVDCSKDIDSLSLDAIIFGSDAIFNTKHPFFEPLYMGVDIHTDKIAYSASCENLPPNYLLSREEVDSLQEFKAISVRDCNTQELLINNGINKPSITCDPTILYDFNDITCEWKFRNYILVYSFSEWNDFASEMKLFANKHKISILSIGRYCDWADFSIDDASFEQWIAAFKYAEFVFTDSFHGTVFALKNRKELILVSREDKKAKIKSLLRDCKINRGFIESGESIETYINQSIIDYDVVENRLADLKDRSLNYLRKALNL